MNALLLTTNRISKPERPKKNITRSASTDMVIPFQSVQANVNNSLKTIPKLPEIIKSKDLGDPVSKKEYGGKSSIITLIKLPLMNHGQKNQSSIQFLGKDLKNQRISTKSVKIKDGKNTENIKLSEPIPSILKDKIITRPTPKTETQIKIPMTTSGKKKLIPDVQKEITFKTDSNINSIKNGIIKPPAKTRIESAIQKRSSEAPSGVKKNKLATLQSKIQSSQSTLIRKITNEPLITKFINLYHNTMTPGPKITSVGVIKHVSAEIIQVMSQGQPNNAVYKVNGGELGNIEIQLFQEQAATKATIVVETESAKSTMDKMITTIKDNLMKKGIMLETFSVEVNSGGGKKSYRAKTFQERMNVDIALDDEVEVNTPRLQIRNYGYNTIEIMA